MSHKNTRSRRSIIEPLEQRALLATTYPSSSVTVTGINTWGGTHSLTVKYDSTLQVRRDTLDDRDIQIVGPNGYDRRGKLYWIDKPTNSKRLYARYKVAARNGFWSSADNGVYTVYVNKGQVRDTANNPTRYKLLGTFTVNVPKYATETDAISRAPITALDVEDYGAIPGDGLDDTDAVQAAIDDLPLAAGVPNGISPIGGYVSFSEGEYTFTRPLRITSGVWLRGVGNSTILRNTSTDPNDAAIYLYSAYSHGGIVGTRVQNLKVVTDAAKGVQVNPSNPGDLNNLRLDSLTISSGGTAIDLRNVDVYQSQIQNIVIEDPGAAALWLLVSRNNSAINGFRNITVRGIARAGFDSTDPLVSIGGHSIVEGLKIEDIGAPVVPLYAADVRATFNGVLITTNTANLINNELIRMERSWIRFDRIQGLASGRKLRLITTRDAHFTVANVEVGSTLANSIVTDAASHVTIDTLYAGGGIGSPTPGRISVRKVTSLAMPAMPTYVVPRESAPASQVVVNVEDWGAFGNDPFEDTAQIQAAIDSLPPGTGIPGNGSTVGGTIVLPIGTYVVTQPLRIPSGVWIVGNGWGTTIRNTSTDGTSAAFVFVGNAGTGLNIGAGLVNLGIHTTAAASVRAHSSLTGGLIDMTMRNIAFATGGVGVDLQNVRTYHARLDTLLFRDPVGTSLWLGDDFSMDNRITGLKVIGNALNGSQTLKAHVVLQGQTTLEQSWIELNNMNETPLHVTGDITIRNIWLEDHFSDLPGDVKISFENVYKADIDVLLLIDHEHKLKFRKSTGVKIANLDIAGYTQPLKDNLDMDSVSRVEIETVHAIWDTGMLDDPRLTISATYNKTTAIFTDVKAALFGQNLLADPNMTDVGSDASDAWRVQMGDFFGVVEGSYSVEQTANGPRLKIVVTSNPNDRRVRIDMKMNITSAHFGKQPIARYRVDGPGTTIAWGEDFTYQYGSRESNTLVAAAAPATISADTTLILVLPSTPGTYYISKVGLVAGS